MCLWRCSCEVSGPREAADREIRGCGVECLRCGLAGSEAGCWRRSCCFLCTRVNYFLQDRPWSPCMWWRMRWAPSPWWWCPCGVWAHGQRSSMCWNGGAECPCTHTSTTPSPTTQWPFCLPSPWARSGPVLTNPPISSPSSSRYNRNGQTCIGGFIFSLIFVYFFGWSTPMGSLHWKSLSVFKTAVLVQKLKVVQGCSLWCSPLLFYFVSSCFSDIFGQFL